MIKQYSITLLLSGVALSFISGSFLAAADRGQRKTPQAPQRQQTQQRQQTPQPKQNPFQRYNDVAQKYYEAEPTEKTVKEFKELLEKDKFFNIKPQCKKELDLLLKDVEAKVETNNLLQAREEQIASIKKSAATIRAAQEQGIPTNLSPQGAALWEKTIEKFKKQKEQQGAPTPQVKPTTQPAAPTTPEKPKTLRDVLGEEEEKPEEEPTLEPIPRKFELTPEIEPSIPAVKPEIAAQISEDVLNVQPEAPATVLAPYITSPSPTQKQLALPAVPIADQEALKPVYKKPLNIITQEALQAHNLEINPAEVDRAINNNTRIFAQLPQELIQANSSAIQFFAAADPSTIKTSVRSLIAKIGTALVSADMSKTMQASGIMVTANQPPSFESLPDWIFNLGKAATKITDYPEYSLRIKNTINLFENLTDNIKKVAPTVTTGLLLASDKQTTDALDANFISLLLAFDALMNNIGTQKELEVLGVPKLFALAGNLSLVGIPLINAIEEYAADFETAMSEDLRTKFNSGRLKIKRPRDKELKNHKRDYRNELTTKLLNLKKTADKGISMLEDKKAQEKFRKDLQLLVDQFKESIVRKETVPEKEQKSTIPTYQAAPKFGSRGTGTGTGAFRKGTVQSKLKKTREEALTPFIPTKETEKEEPSTALVPAKTAHPVTTPSAKQQFYAIKKELALVERNITKPDVDEQLSKIGWELRSLQKIDQDEYDTVSDKIRLMKKWILPIQRVQESTQKLKIRGKTLTARELNTPKEQLERYKNDTELQFPETAYKQLTAEIEAATKTYIENSIQSLEEPLLKLHTKVAANINAYDEIPSDISKKVDSLFALKTQIPTNMQSRINAIFASVCAFYDAILYALYTPKVFNAALNPAEKTEGSEKEPIDYITLVSDIRNVLEEIHFEDTLNILATLSKEANQFNAHQFDLLTTTTNSEFMNDDNSYKYAIEEGKEVQIDEKTTIPTLVAVTPFHKKELGYLEILEQWENRVENNGIINELIDFTRTGIKPENIEEIKNLLGELEKVNLPSTFGEELMAKLNEAGLETAEQTIGINEKIEALKKEVTEAHDGFNKDKTIKNISFQAQYSTIQSSIETLSKEKQQPLMAELNDVAKLFGAYLTDIITKNFITTLSTLPATAYQAQSDILQTMDQVDAELKKSATSLSLLLSQVKELPLIATIDDTANPFHALATTVIQGFGYILATFDAVGAKLADGANVEKSFWQKIGVSGSPTQYDIARKLIDAWLPAINTLRKDYYAPLIASFLGDAPVIKEQYQNNKLALTELGLTGIATSYQYLRENITGYPQLPKLEVVLPNGFHKPIVAKKDAGDPYAAIIIQWNKFIAESLKSADLAAHQKQVEALLKAILNAKVAGAPFGSINQESEKNNVINTLPKISKGTVDGRQTIAELNELITLMENPELLKELAKLQPLTQTMQEYVDQICGNSFALLDGLIYWIYETTKDSDKSNQIVGEIAAAFQEPITQLVEAALKFVPFTSGKFKNLWEYAPKTEFFTTGIGTVMPSKVPYRYFIGEKATAANVGGYKAAKFKGDPKIQLLQDGNTIDKNTVKKQLQKLDLMIKKIVSPLNKLAMNTEEVIAMIQKLAQENDAGKIERSKQVIMEKFATMATIKTAITESAELGEAQELLNAIALLLIRSYGKA